MLVERVLTLFLSPMQATMEVLLQDLERLPQVVVVVLGEQLVGQAVVVVGVVNPLMLVVLEQYLQFQALRLQVMEVIMVVVVPLVKVVVVLVWVKLVKMPGRLREKVVMEDNIILMVITTIGAVVVVVLVGAILQVPLDLAEAEVAVVNLVRE